MTALTAGRLTKRRDAKDFSFAVLAATACYAGGIAVLDGGFAVPGSTDTGLVAVGVFMEDADNSAGANGDIYVPVARGCFQFANSAAADEITAADIGSNCYIVDDQTVAKTDGTASRSVAGVIRDVDANGVWVEF